METASSGIVVVCGLGNPGEEYARTRHNAGFATVDELARRWGVSYWKSQAGSEVAVVRRGDRDVVLAKPQAFMNVSGGPVAKLVAAYHATPQQLLVVHDEVELPAGDVRVKVGGGHAGHNGLRSIIDKLGTRDFARVRFGIGRPPGRMDVADYVLRQLKGTFADEFDTTTAIAADVVESCLTAGVTATLDHYNGTHGQSRA